MDGADRPARVISREAAAEAQAWETPDFDQPQREQQRLAELEQARRIERDKARRRRQRRREAVHERLRREDEARRVLPAPEEIEQLRATARREGHEEGYREGRHEGYHAGYPEGLRAGEADGRQAGAALVQRLRALLDTLGRPLEQLDREAEEELLHLALALARRVVYEEVKADPSHTAAAVRRALAELPATQRTVTVYVHPEELGFIREQVGDEAAGAGWSVVADPHLARGGCVVTTESSRVDATIERRLDAVAEQLLGDARAAEPAEPTVRTYRGAAEAPDPAAEEPAQAAAGEAEASGEGEAPS